MKRNLFRKIIGGLSLTSALFVFQACYGTPQDFGLDFRLEGCVKSKVSGLPLAGIRVSLGDGEYSCACTENDGTFLMYVDKLDTMKLSFQDVDSIYNGQYLDKDTVLVTGSNDHVFVEIALDEK